MLTRSQQSILILSGQYGDGHHQAAVAIKKMILKMYPHYNVQIKDPQQLTHPRIDHLSKQLYLFGVKRFPNIYHYLYQKTKEPNSASPFFKGMTRLGLKRLAQWITEIDPAVIICTCPLSCGMAALLKKYRLIHVPVAAVITDYSVHNYWMHPQIDHYLVGSQEVKEGMLKYGIENHQISVTGVPTDMKFAQVFDKEKLKKKYGLQTDMPTVLISGGGQGIIGNGASILDTLEQMDVRLQIICICGHNQGLYQRMIKGKQNSKHLVHIKGYVNNMEELMAVSDIMVTKAGGLTISEALTMSLPLLIYRSIGGQESDNSKYLLKSRTALAAADEQELIEGLSRLVKDEHLRMKMIQQMEKTQQKKSAFNAVQTTFQLLSESYLHHA